MQNKKGTFKSRIKKTKKLLNYWISWENTLKDKCN